MPAKQPNQNAAAWGEAARAIHTRMDELGLTQQDVVAESGLSLATVREMLGGMARQRSSDRLAAMSRALRWPETRLEELLAAGGGPEPTVAERLTAIEERLAAIERRLSGGD